MPQHGATCAHLAIWAFALPFPRGGLEEDPQGYLPPRASATSQLKRIPFGRPYLPSPPALSGFLGFTTHSTRTTKALSSGMFSRSSSLRLHTYLGLLWPKCNTLHCAPLNIFGFNANAFCSRAGDCRVWGIPAWLCCGITWQAAQHHTVLCSLIAQWGRGETQEKKKKYNKKELVCWDKICFVQPDRKRENK